MEKHWENISLVERDARLKGFRLGLGDFEKGHIPWNIGFTKFTDKRVAEYGKKSGDSRGGTHQTEIHIENMRKATTGKNVFPNPLKDINSQLKNDAEKT